MPVICCVPGCKQDNFVPPNGGDLSGHRVPFMDNGRIRKWRKQIKNGTGIPLHQVFNCHSRICSRHFDITDFRFSNKGQKILQKTAIPSVFQVFCNEAAHNSASGMAGKLKAEKQSQGVEHSPDMERSTGVGLPVACKGNKATLFIAMLKGKASRGCKQPKCILYEGDWHKAYKFVRRFVPRVCCWKKNLTHHGQTVFDLILSGEINMNSGTCRCGPCVTDGSRTRTKSWPVVAQPVHTTTAPQCTITQVYVCGYCDSTFAGKEAYKEHLRLKHPAAKNSQPPSMSSTHIRPSPSVTEVRQIKQEFPDSFQQPVVDLGEPMEIANQHIPVRSAPAPQAPQHVAQGMPLLPPPQPQYTPMPTLLMPPPLPPPQPQYTPMPTLLMPPPLPPPAKPVKEITVDDFTNEEILAKLLERKATFICKCGIIFRDQTLFFLHRGTHKADNPYICSFCDHLATDWYDFNSHQFFHSKPQEGDC